MQKPPLAPYGIICRIICGFDAMDRGHVCIIILGTLTQTVIVFAGPHVPDRTMDDDFERRRELRRQKREEMRLEAER